MSRDIELELKTNPPKFPRKSFPYRIHWNWELSFRCNYQCTYCHNWSKKETEVFWNVDVAMWKDIWDRMFEKYWCCHIRFSGGEPTIYPNFFDLLAILLEKHTVDITTNLSFDINLFAEKVKPGGISISTSFHPEYNEIKPFLDKALFLHKSGYPSTICMVGHPLHLYKIPYFKSVVEKEGIIFKVIPFQGQYEDKKYPDSYTSVERCLLEGIATGSKNTHANDINSRWYEWNVKKEKVEIEKKGKPCRMGEMYAIIHPDGQVTSCCAKTSENTFVEPLGSIFDPDLHLLGEPTICKADRCPCFKSMLVGDEQDKWMPLWEALDHPVYKTEYMKRYLGKDKEGIQLSNVTVIADTVGKEVPSDGYMGSLRHTFAPYRVFYTWDIHYACNYRCSYCFFAGEWDKKSEQNRYPGLQRWKDIWDDIFVKYGSGHIHVSGGEPFTYPSFIDMVSYLSIKHTVEFDTNLAFDVDEFLSKVGPNRVKFAASFHPEFISIETYLDKACRLKANGFDIGINYVAAPGNVKRMKEYKETFAGEHISFNIMPFRGEYRGKKYPHDYSAEEKELMKACDPETAPRMLDSYGGEEKNCRKGQICRMGQMYTKIHPDGTAYRCCYIDEKGKLGNLIDGTFSLYHEPRICEYIECPCWVAMVVDKEENWAFHWRLPKSVEEAIAAGG